MRKGARQRGVKGAILECPDGFVFERVPEFVPSREYNTPTGKKRAGGKTRQKRYWHTTKRKLKNGAPVQVCLIVWVGHCAKCGKPFEVRTRWLDTERASAFKLRHCEAHRLTLAQCTARAAMVKNIKAAPLRAEVESLLKAGHSVRAVVLTTGCPIATVYRWKRVGQTPT